MMRGKSDVALYVGALALGFLIPFWPLVIGGALGAVATGQLLIALGAAFLFDLVFGPWPLFGFSFPFSVVILCAALLSLFVKRYIRAR